LLFLGHDVVDVRLETRVGLKDLCAYATLGGGLDLALLAGGELETLSVLDLRVDSWVRTNFLLEHDCGYMGG
jgi:hypothetical protein